MNASWLQRVNEVSKRANLFEQDLTRCKKILKDNHNMDLKIFESIKINYLFLHSYVQINGIDELEFFWGIMFDYNIRVDIKAKFQQCFMKSLIDWQQYYSHIFQQGLEKSIDLFNRIISLQSKNGTVLSANVILPETDIQYSILIKDDSDLNIIFETLQFITKCCLKTVKFSSSMQNRFKDVVNIILKLLNIGMNILTSNQIQKSIIQTANEIIDVCLQMNLLNQQKMVIIEDLCKGTNLDELILSVYNSGTNYVVKNGIQNSWIALNTCNLQQQQQYLRNKIDIAKVHLKYISIFNQNYHFNMNFLCNQQLFLKNLLNTIYNFIIITENDQNYELKDEFISYLLEIYQNYLIKNAVKFDKMQPKMMKMIIIPLLIVKSQYYQNIFMKDPSKFLYYLQEIIVQQQLNVASVKAAKILRIIIQNKQIMQKLVQSLISKLENSNNRSEYLDVQQINYETVWLVLLAITPKLKQQQSVIRKILTILSNNKQLFVSNIGLCIILYFIHTVPEYHCQMEDIIYNLLREILQRHCPQLLIFLFQLLSNQQCCINSLYLVWISYRMLIDQKMIKNKEICWRIFHRSINFYMKQIPQRELYKIVNEFIVPRLQILEYNSKAIYAFSLYQLIKLIYNLLQNCKHDQISIIQPSFFKLSVLFSKIIDLGFDEQLLHIITLYFTKIDKVRAEHNPFLIIVLQKFYRQSFSLRQKNEIFLSFCKNVIKIPFQQQQINPLLLISQTLIQNAKHYNTMECSGLEEQIYESLLILQEIIHRQAENMPKHLKEQICKIFMKWNIVYNKTLYLRIANVIISCRVYTIPHSFSWHQVENMIIQSHLQNHEARKLISNLQNLLGRVKPIRSPKDYAFVLSILYKIMQKYQAKQPQQNKILQSIKAKVHQIFIAILKRKRLVLNEIKKQLGLKCSLYYERWLLGFEQERQKMYGMQYLSMIL